MSVHRRLAIRAYLNSICKLVNALQHQRTSLGTEDDLLSGKG